LTDFPLVDPTIKEFDRAFLWSTRPSNNSTGFPFGRPNHQRIRPGFHLVDPTIKEFDWAFHLVDPTIKAFDWAFIWLTQPFKAFD
jgi:hypothetical protein